MPGREKYTNEWMTVDFNSYWLNSVGETYHPMILSDWMTEIYYSYSHNWMAFDKLREINVWSPYRTDCPEIKNYAGLTYYDGHIDINQNYINKGTLSHEFGHFVAFANDMGDWADQYGQKMWKLYTDLRGRDFTANTNAGERWAEDFKFFFGCIGVKGVVERNDDSNTYGSSVRKPNNVEGLENFIRYFCAVLPYWRRIKSITLANVSYNPNTRVWMWSRPTYWFQQWECFQDGKFYVWQNNTWVEMKA